MVILDSHREFGEETGGIKSIDFGMVPTGNFVVSPAHDPNVFYHHGADHRIRRGKAFTLGSKVQSHIHEMTVIHNCPGFRDRRSEVRLQKTVDRTWKVEWGSRKI